MRAVAFYVKPFADSNAERATLYLSQYGSDPQPAYTLRRPDPSLETSKNGYALALFDSYNPDVLFGEVLIRPQWAAAAMTSTPSTAEGRRNGNQPPPAELILPSDFVVHLYAPNQQVHVRQKQGSWVGSTSSWEFELPQNTFRQPSASDLDRSQNDPAASETTPRYHFRWKRDGKLSKDLICRLSGRSNDSPGAKKKKSTSTDPDIAVALFQQQREITLYEPNLSRIEIEDPKGFEVVTLLSAIVIRDIFLGNVREAFNLSTSARRARMAEEGSANAAVTTAGNRAISLPTVAPTPAPAPLRVDPAVPSMSHGGPLSAPQGWKAMFPSQRPAVSPPLAAPPHSQPNPHPHPGPPPPLRSSSSRNAEQAEVRRIEKMLEAEKKKETRRRQAQVDRETERLRRLYGQEEKLAAKQFKASSSSIPRLVRVPPSPAVQSEALSSTFVTIPASTPARAAVVGGGDEDSGFLHTTSLNPSSSSSHQAAIAARAPSDGHLHTTPDTGSGRTILPKRSIFGLRSRSHDVDAVKSHKKSSRVF